MKLSDRGEVFEWSKKCLFYTGEKNIKFSFVLCEIF